MSSQRWNGTQADLYDLLIGLFEPRELEMFVSRLPFGDRMVTELPGGSVPKSSYLCQAVRVLDQFGALDAGFFRALLATRPGRAEEILALARSGGVQVRASARGPGGG